MIYNDQFEQPARVRIVHGAPMAQPVDVYLNDRLVVRGLPYGQSTQFIPIPRGMYTVKIYSTSGNNLLLTKNLEIEGTKVVTATTEDGQLVLRVTEEKMDFYDQMMPQYGFGMQPQMGMNQMMPQTGMFDQSMCDSPMCGYGMGKGWQSGYQQAPYQTGEYRDNKMIESARVRFAHFSPNAPAVDITLPNGTVLFRNVPYKAVTDYIRVAPGTYTLQVRPTGSNQVVLTVPDVVINPNDMKTIYAIGLVNDTPGLEAVILNDRRMI